MSQESSSRMSGSDVADTPVSVATITLDQRAHTPSLSQESVMRAVIREFQLWLCEHLDQWGIEPSESQQEKFLTKRLPEILGIFRTIETQGVKDMETLQNRCRSLVAGVMHTVQMAQSSATVIVHEATEVKEAIAS